jgi:hypothetical protein
VAAHHQSDTGFTAPVFDIQRPLVDTVYVHPAEHLVCKILFTPANNRAPPA